MSRREYVSNMDKKNAKANVKRLADKMVACAGTMRHTECKLAVGAYMLRVLKEHPDMKSWLDQVSVDYGMLDTNDYDVDVGSSARGLDCVCGVGMLTERMNGGNLACGQTWVSKDGCIVQAYGRNEYREVRHIGMDGPTEIVSVEYHHADGHVTAQTGWIVVRAKKDENGMETSKKVIVSVGEPGSRNITRITYDVKAQYSQSIPRHGAVLARLTA